MKVILSTYLTKKGDPQRKTFYQPNDHNLISAWYEGIENGVVFHDQLTEEFVSNYPKVKFIKVDSYPHSTNDGRFILYRDYLIEHKEIDQLFMTDLFDVKVNYFPELDDSLYIANEGRSWNLHNKWIRDCFDRCGIYGLQGKIIYNAGVIGGKREVILPFLNELAECLEPVGERNCNMVLVNYLVHKMRNVVTGYPLHSEFKRYQSDSKAAFIHK